MAINFAGKVAVVTGAGNGLGRSHALELAKRGAKIVVNDFGVDIHGNKTNSEPANQVVAEIRTAGGEAVAHSGSVADSADVEQLVKTAMDAYGRADIIVNNAGVVRDKSFGKMTMEDFRFVVDVHLTGSARVTQAFWPVMKAQRYGRVVFTTSTAGVFGSFGQANYASAKMGLFGLMKTLRLEGARDNIRLNIISPFAATRISATATAAGADSLLSLMKVEHVSAGVLVLVCDEAPDGMALCAGGGSFSEHIVTDTEGVYIDREHLTAELVQAALPQIRMRHTLIDAPDAPTQSARLLALGKLG